MHGKLIHYESVVLLQDRSSQQPSVLHLAIVTLIACESVRFLPRRCFCIHMCKWRSTVGSDRLIRLRVGAATTVAV